MSKRRVVNYNGALEFLQREGYRVYDGKNYDYEKASFYIQVLDCIHKHPNNSNLYVVYDR